MASYGGSAAAETGLRLQASSQHGTPCPEVVGLQDCTANFPLGGPTLGCAGKYGEEKWAEYQERVPYRIMPGVYWGLAGGRPWSALCARPEFRTEERSIPESLAMPLRLSSGNMKESLHVLLEEFSWDSQCLHDCHPGSDSCVYGSFIDRLFGFDGHAV